MDQLLFYSYFLSRLVLRYRLQQQAQTSLDPCVRPVSAPCTQTTLGEMTNRHVKNGGHANNKENSGQQGCRSVMHHQQQLYFFFFASNEASRKLKSCAGFFFGTGAGAGAAAGSGAREDAVAEPDSPVSGTVALVVVGSGRLGQHAENVAVGCLFSQCALASMFFFVTRISNEHILQLTFTSGSLTRDGRRPCSSPIPAALFDACSRLFNIL